MNEDPTSVYRDEAKDWLADIEAAILELETSPEDKGLINRVFRGMHTIKGSGAMFGFEDIAAFTHEVETVLDKARNGLIPVTRELMSMVLSAKDFIADMIADPQGVAPEDAAARESLIGSLKAVYENTGEKPKAQPETDKQAGQNREKSVLSLMDDNGDHSPGRRLFRIRYKPNADIFTSGADIPQLFSELCNLGECRFFAHTDSIPGLSRETDQTKCHVWWDILLVGETDENSIRDVFIFVQDSIELSVQAVNPEEGIDLELEYKKLGEILLEKGDLDREKLDGVLQSKKLLGQIITEAGLVSEQKVQAALAEQKMARDIQSKRKMESGGIRVAEEKLDKLVDLVGELVILQARFNQAAGRGTRKGRLFQDVMHELERLLRKPPKGEKKQSARDASDFRRLASDINAAIHRTERLFASFSEELERLSDEMRYHVFKIRMLPFNTLIGKFRRLVRDLSNELGKEAELVVVGEETELDKSVIDKLSDPLIHIIRNSVDHGIELPEERLRQEKDAKGKIVLSAEHAGGCVLIKISDDGKGLDSKRIMAKAIERGMITADAQFTKKDIFGLIFQPGFSTAERITEVSGRGVGMDVVKKNIDSLQGTIEIDSEPGKGTIMTIKLPLTLAIIDGLHVRVGSETFIVPLQIVNECVDTKKKDVFRDGTRKLYNHRGDMIPYVHLSEYFGIKNGNNTEYVKIVITTFDRKKAGLVVDEVIGQCQTVIKSLGGVYKRQKSLAGASISGDGSVILILDVPYIIRDMAYSGELKS